MLGITNWSEFWISFWSALFAGAIDSLLIGFIVGVMILFFQWRIDKRRLRQQYEREVATFREKLRFTLNQPNRTIIDEILMPSSLVKALIPLLSEFPIDLWSEYLPDQEKLFHSVKVFQSAYADFSLTAMELDTLVTTLIRQVNNSHNIGMANDGYQQIYFLGRILNIPGPTLMRWIQLGLYDEDDLKPYENKHELILEDTTMQELIPLYRKTFEALIVGLEKIKEILTEPMDTHRKWMTTPHGN